MLRIETKSGSVYLIDTENHRWVRFSGEEAAETRTDSGDYLRIRFDWRLNGGLVLICPPINPGSDFRVIESTPIMKWNVIPEFSEVV